MSADTLEREPATYQRALSSVVDPDRRLEFIRLVTNAVETADAENFDIVLLAARRMTCLYSVLRESDMPAPKKATVISDRYIELMEPSFWANKKVLLVDDTVVSGGTIRDRREIAQRLVGHSPEIRTMYGAKLGKGHEDESFQLHRQFAEAFAKQLVPFFTDFPITDGILVDAATFDRMLSARAWRTVDVTNSVTVGTGARAYSLFPRKAMISLFEQSIGDVAKIIELVKVRVFAFDEGANVRLRVVPLVLTKSLTEVSLSDWLQSVGIARSGNEGQVRHALGLVSFLLSREFLRHFAEYAVDELGLELEEDEDNALLTLGEYLNGVADPKNLSTLNVLRASNLEDETIVDPVFALPGIAEETGSHYAILGDDVAIPGFESLQRTHSLVGRLRQKGWEKHATTLTGIAEISDSNLVTASLAIDVLNDLGYAVPASLSHDGQVFRGYRAGEDGLRAIEDFPTSRLGGKLAAVPVTKQISNALYFEESVDDASPLDR